MTRLIRSRGKIAYRCSLTSTVIWCCVNSAPAVAAEQPDGFVLEEVQVTARRVEERLQDTPVSVAAFTPETLERRQVFSTDDLDQTTPNLVFNSSARLAGNSSAVVVTIRGIGQTDPTPDVDPGVGIYIDDVYMGHGVGGSMDFRDIDSVQVLRGPQGTLFGRNTIGGAVLITTKDPQKEFGGTAKVGLGSDNLHDVFLGLDLPISDTLGARVSMGGREQDGYIDYPAEDKKLGDTNTYTVTGKLLWTPTEQLTAKLMFDYTEADENGAALTNVAINPASAFPRNVSFLAGCPGMTSLATPVPQIADPRCANDLMLGGPYVNNGSSGVNSALKNRGVGLNIQYDLSDHWSVKSISSYREIEWNGNRDADGTPFPILSTDYDVDGNQWSQELQLIFRGGRLTALSGAYYFKERSDDYLIVTFSPPGVTQSPPGFTPPSTGNCDCNLVKNHSWAAFTNWTYELTDKLSIGAGARYTSDTKGSLPDEYDLRTPNVKWLPVRLYEKTFSKTTFSGNISYRWSDAAMTYLSYAQGFKGGGWNSHFNRAIQPTDPHLFKEETAESYEAGFKLDLFAATLRLNGAIFTTDYQNMQFTYRIGVAPFLFNTGKATINGGELELTWIPVEALIVEGGVGYLDGEIEEVDILVNAVTGVSTANKLPFTPSWQANLGVGYRIVVGDGWRLTPRVDGFYQSRTYFDEGNTRQIAQLDPVKTVSASLSLESPGERWRVVVAGRNLSDELYSQGGNPSFTSSSGYAEASYVRGREYLISVAYDF
jgi:iron complex outermembrane receptor protein